MCAKLVFRGADVNHLYRYHGGMPAIAIMVEQKNDLAVKFLLDKLANPHIVFGFDNKDACDLAKSNGLDKRFFVFGKCNGEHKLYSKEPFPGSITDHRKESALATTDFNKILEQARKLDAEDDGRGDNMEWIQDDLRDGMEKHEITLAKGFKPHYKSDRFDMLDDLANSKRKVQQELEEYKAQFAIPEQEVKLTKVSYPPDLAREVQLKIEADRVRRQIEYDQLMEQRKISLE